MKTHHLLLFCLLILLTGCSAKEAPDTTPTFHVGTPTNRSSINSWEIGTQAGRGPTGATFNGRPLLKPIPSEMGYEPNDPVALQVYSALSADHDLDTRYVSPKAKNGVVILIGTVDTLAQKAQIEKITRSIPGVKKVKSELTVAHG